LSDYLTESTIKYFERKEGRHLPYYLANGDVEHGATSHLNMRPLEQLSITEPTWIIKNYHKRILREPQNNNLLTHVTHSAVIIPETALIHQGRGVTTMPNDQRPLVDSDFRRNDVTEEL
jgi:hypothetical protein